VVAPIPIVIRAFQGRWDPFEPINLIVIGVIVIFVARPIAELKLNLQPYFPLYSDRPGFNGALEVGLAGTIALYIGYFWSAGGRLAARVPTLPESWDAKRSVRFTLWMLAAGAFLTLLFMAQVGPRAVLDIYTGRAAAQAGLYRASPAFFQQGPDLSVPAAFILLIAYQKHKTWPTRLLLIFTVLLALAITVPNGDRTFILELALPLVVLWYLRRNRRPKVISIVVAFVLLVLVANVMVAYRNKATRTGQNIPAEVESAFTHPGQELEHFISGADPSEFSVLAIEMNQYKIGFLKFQPGSTIRSILIGWIPHELLGSKPLTPLQYISWTLFPATDDFSSYGPSMFGSMYADMGWVTVVLLSLLVGIALRAIWDYFRERLNVGGMQLVFAGTLPLVIIMLRDDIDDIVYRSAFLAIPLLLCVLICSRPPKQVRRWRALYANRPPQPSAMPGPAVPSGISSYRAG